MHGAAERCVKKMPLHGSAAGRGLSLRGSVLASALAGGLAVVQEHALGRQVKHGQHALASGLGQGGAVGRDLPRVGLRRLSEELRRGLGGLELVVDDDDAPLALGQHVDAARQHLAIRHAPADGPLDAAAGNCAQAFPRCQGAEGQVQAFAHAGKLLRHAVRQHPRPGKPGKALRPFGAGLQGRHVDAQPGVHGVAKVAHLARQKTETFLRRSAGIGLGRQALP